MRSDEEIATEAAGRIYRLYETTTDGDSESLWRGMCFSTIVTLNMPTGPAEQWLRNHRAAARHALLDVIRETIREMPEPSPVPPGRLDDIARDSEKMRFYSSARVQDALDMLDEVMKHVRHTDRLLAVLLRDEPGQAYVAGYDAGRASVNKGYE